jgi:hypothetical protein
MDNKFIEISDYTSEIRKWYKDFSPLKGFVDYNKKVFFRESAKKLNKFLKIIIDLPNWDLSDQQPFYSVLGVFYEILMKICVAKEDWNSYIESYSENEQNKNFEFAKQKLMILLKTKINDKQCIRMKDIFDYIQVQRNNFLHNPFKGASHDIVEREVFLSILVLNKLFDVDLNEDNVNNLKQYIDNYKILTTGQSEFEDVELEKIFS